MNVREASHRVSGRICGLTKGALGAATLAAAMLLTAPLPAVAEDDANPAIWKMEVQDNYAALLEDVKSGLEAQQFTVLYVSDLAGALATNREVLGVDKWNTIGFDQAQAVQFCSLLFNQEVLNLNMDYSVLCPFKVVLYSMQDKPDMVTILMVRPTYVLAHYKDPSAAEIGKRIEDRIIAALKEAMPH
ncbi:MAG: DUF302 domain-containing protein [Chromatiales bacterium]|jgi:uncharacterized protein (DUF302 family)